MIAESKRLQDPMANPAIDSLLEIDQITNYHYSFVEGGFQFRLDYPAKAPGTMPIAFPPHVAGWSTRELGFRCPPSSA